MSTRRFRYQKKGGRSEHFPPHSTSFAKPPVSAAKPAFKPAPPPAPRKPAGPGEKSCGHWCDLFFNHFCCQCSDRRPSEASYVEYVDGKGYIPTATREKFYCASCKQYAIKCADYSTPKHPTSSSIPTPMSSSQLHQPSVGEVSSHEIIDLDDEEMREILMRYPSLLEDTPVSPLRSVPPASQQSCSVPSHLPAPAPFLPEFYAPNDENLIPRIESGIGSGKERDKFSMMKMEMEDILTCVICTDIFGHDPITIPCGHSFCRECLLEAIKISKRSCSEGNFPCPLCRIPVRINMVNKIQPSHALRNMVGLYKITYEAHR